MKFDRYLASMPRSERRTGATIAFDLKGRRGNNTLETD